MIFHLLIWTVIGALVLIASVLVGYAMMSADQVRAVASQLMGESVNFTYSDSRHAHMSRRFLILGSAFSGLAYILAIYRLRIEPFWRQLARDCSDFFTALGISFRGAFISQPLYLQFTLAAIVFLGAALRFHFLNTPIALAEGHWLWLVDQPALLGFTNQRMTLHGMLLPAMKFSAALFGDDEWAFRLPVLTFGIALLPLTYWVGQVLFHPRVALIAAAVIAVAWPMVAYSVTARGYAFGNVFFLAMIDLTPYIARTRNLGAMWAFTLFSALAGYSVLSMAFVHILAVSFLGLAIIQNGGVQAVIPSLKITSAISLGSGLLVLALFSPLVFTHGLVKAGFLGALQEGRDHIGFLELLTDQPVRLWPQWMTDIPVTIQVVILVGLISGLFGSRRGLTILAALIIAFSPLVVIVGRKFPPARVWKFLVPLVAIFAASGSDFVKRRSPEISGLKHSGAILLVVLVAWGCARAVDSDNVLKLVAGRNLNRVDEFTRVVAQRVKAGDVIVDDIVMVPAFSYYLAKALRARGLRFYHNTVPATKIGAHVCAAEGHCPKPVKDGRVFLQKIDQARIFAARPYGFPLTLQGQLSVEARFKNYIMQATRSGHF